MSNPLADDLDNILARTEPLWKELRGERILITGATGFFGCWLLESFAWANRVLNLGAQAVALSRQPATLGQKAPHLAADPAISFHASDIRHGDFPQGSFSHVIHAAAEASARLNREAPLVMFETVFDGTRRALQHAIATSTERFLFVSSGAVYGTQPPHVVHLEETFAGGPDTMDRNSAYAEGKRAAELLCALATSPRLAVTIARCFAFVGPYMPLNAHFAIGNFISDALRGQTIRIKSDGSPFRSYLYASDLAVWLWTVLFKGDPGRAYNVGSEEALSIADVADAVAATAGPQKIAVSVAKASSPNPPVHRYVPSTARARQELGLTTEVPLQEGIRRTYRWFAQRNATEQPAAARGTHA